MYTESTVTVVFTLHKCDISYFHKCDIVQLYGLRIVKIAFVQPCTQPSDYY